MQQTEHKQETKGWKRKLNKKSSQNRLNEKETKEKVKEELLDHLSHTARKRNTQNLLPGDSRLRQVKAEKHLSHLEVQHLVGIR